MHSLLDDPDSICIVRECRELEASFRTQFTDQLLAEADNVSVRGIKNQLLEIDKEIMLATCDTKTPLIGDVCKCSGAWLAVWDSARHLWVSSHPGPAVSYSTTSPSWKRFLTLS